jgi:prepilin-type processing-associated H-X9-DG protein
VHEVWWAPYDNRPGSSPTQALNGSYPPGLIWPFIEQNPKVFKCPNGIDLTPGSPTMGQTYQVSYGMNYVTGGPSGKRLNVLTEGTGTSNLLFVWDHGRTPGCANSKVAAPRGPWKPFVNPGDLVHYPAGRHGGVFNGMYCDGHVVPLAQGDLSHPMFVAQ